MGGCVLDGYYDHVFPVRKVSPIVEGAVRARYGKSCRASAKRNKRAQGLVVDVLPPCIQSRTGFFWAQRGVAFDQMFSVKQSSLWVFCGRPVALTKLLYTWAPLPVNGKLVGGVMGAGQSLHWSVFDDTRCYELNVRRLSQTNQQTFLPHEELGLLTYDEALIGAAEVYLCGAAKRNGPTGGCAYGIPRYSVTLLPFPAG